MRLPVREQDGINAVGQNIRRIRKEKKLSMQKLANIAEIELSTMAEIETGQVNPKLSTLLVLAKALEVHPTEFFEGYLKES